jgi:hypothetical protein
MALPVLVYNCYYSLADTYTTHCVTPLMPLLLRALVSLTGLLGSYTSTSRMRSQCCSELLTVRHQLRCVVSFTTL